MTRDQSEILSRELRGLLTGERAHAGFDAAFEGWPEALRGARPEAAPHSAWQLLEHLRIAQWDILEYSRNPQHVSPRWPEGYWPDAVAPASAAAWQKSLEAFRADREAMLALANDPARDPLAALPHVEDGPTLLREVLILADHNAYHLGQVVLLKRLLGAWD